MVSKSMVLAVLGGCAAVALMERQPKTWPVVPKRLLTDFDVYVINLDSATARLDNFRREVAASDLATKSFIRVAGVEGSSLDTASLLTKRARTELAQAESTGFRLRHYQLSRGAVGCYMSHVKLWKSVLATDKDVALIFEDDAQLEPSLYRYVRETPMPTDFDIILLGYVCFKCSRDEGAGFHRVKRFFGLHGYLISAKGIRKILESPRLFPVGKQIDAVLSDMAAKGELTVYASPRKMVEQANELFRTQIQIPIKDGVDPVAALRNIPETAETAETANVP